MSVAGPYAILKYFTGNVITAKAAYALSTPLIVLPRASSLLRKAGVEPDITGL